MSKYPEWIDTFSAMDYPSQPAFETFRNWISLYIGHQTDISDVRQEFLLSNDDPDTETSFS